MEATFAEWQGLYYEGNITSQDPATGYCEIHLFDDEENHVYSTFIIVSFVSVL